MRDKWNFWDTYVGSQSCSEFLRQSEGKNLVSAVRDYVLALPDMFPGECDNLTESESIEIIDALVSCIREDMQARPDRYTDMLDVF